MANRKNYHKQLHSTSQALQRILDYAKSKKTPTNSSVPIQRHGMRQTKRASNH